MNTLIALALSVIALNAFVAVSLFRTSASQRRARTTLSRIMARSFSVERRAMAEWRQHP